jgi:hypothetical protein
MKISDGKYSMRQRRSVTLAMALCAVAAVADRPIYAAGPAGTDCRRAIHHNSPIRSGE